MSNYFLIIKGKQKGPYTAERVQGMWAKKSIAHGTLCQKEGETSPRAIEQFSEIISPKAKSKRALRKDAATTPATSAARKKTRTTGAWSFPSRCIIRALAALVLVAVIAIVAVIAVFRSIQFAFQFDLASTNSLTKVAGKELADCERSNHPSLRSAIAIVARAIWAERCSQARANN